jgi:hypothetical protein
LIGQTLLWNEGAKLVVQASGAAVPAFSATLDGAGVVSLTAPGITPGVPLVVDRTLPFNATWSGSSVGTVSVTLVRAESVGSSTHSVSVVCTFPATAGSGSVPAQLLGQIPAGTNGALSVYGGDSKQVVAGEFTVYVTEISGSTGALVTFQ